MFESAEQGVDGTAVDLDPVIDDEEEGKQSIWYLGESHVNTGLEITKSNLARHKKKFRIGW